jgi:hypothetical protein
VTFSTSLKIALLPLSCGGDGPGTISNELLESVTTGFFLDLTSMISNATSSCSGSLSTFLQDAVAADAAADVPFFLAFFAGGGGGGGGGGGDSGTGSFFLRYYKISRKY